MRLAALAFGAALLATDPQVADACSFAPNETHELDPAFASDTTAPGAPTVTPTVHRWEYPSSCFDIGLIDVAVSATDDVAPADRLGYRFRVLSGDPPDRFGINADAIAPPALDGSDSVSLFFNYMDTEFEFELEVRAVDLNGNEGPPTVVFISDPADGNSNDDTGCSATRSSSANALASLLVLGVLLLALRPRRSASH